MLDNGGESHVVANRRRGRRPGWDRVFTWDGISIGGMDAYDPSVTMASMATRTERVRLRTILTPPRRRGPGSSPRDDDARPTEWRAPHRARRARRSRRRERRRGDRPASSRGASRRGAVHPPGLWSGDPFEFTGKQFRFGPMSFRPTPGPAAAEPGSGWPGSGGWSARWPRAPL